MLHNGVRPAPAPLHPCDMCHVVLQVTYSSDHFDQLYKLAVKLIETGHAYVDHQTATEIKESRCVPLSLLLPWPTVHIPQLSQLDCHCCAHDRCSTTNAVLDLSTHVLLLAC